MSDEELIYDGIDHQLYPMVEGVFLSELDVRLRGIIKQEHPELSDNDFISNKNLTHYRMLFLDEMIDKPIVRMILSENRFTMSLRERITQHWTCKTSWIRKLPLVNELPMMWHVLVVHGRLSFHLLFLW